MNELVISEPTEFGDNVRVKRGKNDCEFLAISLRPRKSGKTWEVMFYRYCVPGRCDLYSFQWNMSDDIGVHHLTYFSDFNIPMAKAIKMAEDDFNRPYVIEMCLEAFSAERVVIRYHRDFLRLLGLVAPKSKTYRKVAELCEKTLEERRIRLEKEYTSKHYSK
jgi:hypothetical protein